MEKELKLLQERYGNYSKVAEALGITPRQLRKIRNQGLKPTATLSSLIACLVREIDQNKEHPTPEPQAQESR